MILSLFLLSFLFTSILANPCDIYATGGTPCVCAHSTVRALYNAYNGPLYQVERASDRKTSDVGLLAAGGHANATEQDLFCFGTSCLITIIYDQSGNANDLRVGTPGGANPRGNTAANAAAETLTIHGSKVYSVYIRAGQGYFRDGSKSGIATGNEAEGIYMVAAGTHVNSGCCFDYGNAEANRRDNGNAHMFSIYFGTSCWFGGCSGTGPWVQGDLENGLFTGGAPHWNPQQKAFPNRFVTATSKMDANNRWSLKGGNAQSGALTTLYDGNLPPGYYPMKKEGGIILGTGGDDSSSSEGTFYEGAMVKGFPSDTTETEIQANIVAAGYGM